MERKNGGLEDDFPFQLDDFRFHVKFQGCMIFSFTSKIGRCYTSNHEMIFSGKAIGKISSDDFKWD